MVLSQMKRKLYIIYNEMEKILTDLRVDELNFLVTKLTVMLSVMKDHGERRWGQKQHPTVIGKEIIVAGQTSQNSACYCSWF